MKITQECGFLQTITQTFWNLAGSCRGSFRAPAVRGFWTALSMIFTINTTSEATVMLRNNCLYDGHDTVPRAEDLNAGSTLWKGGSDVTTNDNLFGWSWRPKNWKRIVRPMNAPRNYASCRNKPRKKQDYSPAGWELLTPLRTSSSWNSRCDGFTSRKRVLQMRVRCALVEGIYKSISNAVQWHSHNKRTCLVEIYIRTGASGTRGLTQRIKLASLE